MPRLVSIEAEFKFSINHPRPFFIVDPRPSPPDTHRERTTHRELQSQLILILLQMQQERQAEIDRQNQVIVTQLMKIKQSPARVDNWNTQWKPTFVQSFTFGPTY